MDIHVPGISTIERWLEAKHVALWSDYDISDPKRRLKAAAWLWGEIQSLDGFAEGERDAAMRAFNAPEERDRVPMSLLLRQLRLQLEAAKEEDRACHCRDPFLSSVWCDG